jgi:hypothetical protein
MTWTQIDTEHFSQYEGMTPSQVGREYLRGYTADLLRKQESAFDFIPNHEPWNYPIDNEDWMTFWKEVYDLKDIPKSEWTDDQWFAYRGLNWLINFALMKA